MKTLITRLFFAFCIIILSGCENENNDNSAPKSYTVLETIEGTWEACKRYTAKTEAHSECISIGKITSQNNDNSEPKSYTVLEAIEGTWEACQPNPDGMVTLRLEYECINIGKITIKDGLYKFDQAEGINKEKFTREELYFLFDNPSGKVKIDYSGNVNPNDPLEIYSDGGGELARISFIYEQGEIKDRYSINVVRGGKSLFFEITYSSLGIWGGVGKNL